MTAPTLYARISGGVVVEIISLPGGLTPANCYTSDLASSMVLCDNTIKQGYTWDGATFHAPVAPTPTPTQVLAGKIAAGIQIQSTGTSSLNGTYPLDDGARENLTGILTDIANGLGLPLSASTVPWADINGTPHNFTAAQLQNFAVAVRDYRYGLQVTWNLLNNSQSASWPSLPVTIA